MKPWADPNHESYHKSRRAGVHTCLGCGCACTYTAWGPWCHPCNVARMTRIGTLMARLALSIGDEQAARKLEQD